MPRASVRPARPVISASKPIKIRQTAPPTDSTIAFVARVVDRLTREISSRFPFHDVSRASIALPTPIARLWRVVSDLADAITRRSDISSNAASVKVPPVSSPTTSVMSLLLLPHSGPRRMNLVVGIHCLCGGLYRAGLQKKCLYPVCNNTVVCCVVQTSQCCLCPYFAYLWCEDCE